MKSSGQNPVISISLSVTRYTGRSALADQFPRKLRPGLPWLSRHFLLSCWLPSKGQPSWQLLTTARALRRFLWIDAIRAQGNQARFNLLLFFLYQSCNQSSMQLGHFILP